ncbi:uncharacterized protein LOC131885611 [Tigriopus californicus]|uniref:uncharacterized protein LOC131885611 n=1 Tax=Tigriopus californicus TaxID=6832 RepID=UPI0027DA4AFC|nr:uncharacterized protein LOC131885611 [Tigriopus californicus]
MTRKRTFNHTHTMIPPRGGSFQWTEIYPLRPNQDLILPGVVIRGNGLDFQVKDRGHYRSRHGFSQTDGIAQYAGRFYASKDQIKNGRDQLRTSEFPYLGPSSTGIDWSLYHQDELLASCFPPTELQTISEFSFPPSRLSVSSQSWRPELNGESRRYRRRHASQGHPHSHTVKKWAFGRTFEVESQDNLERPKSDQRFNRLGKQRKPHSEEIFSPCFSSLTNCGGSLLNHYRPDDLGLMMTRKSPRLGNHRKIHLCNRPSPSSLNLLSNGILNLEAKYRPISRESLQHSYDLLYRNDAQLQELIKTDVSADEIAQTAEDIKDNDSEAENISQMGEELVKDSIEEVSKMLLKKMSVEEASEQTEKHVTFDQAPNIAITLH